MRTDPNTILSLPSGVPPKKPAFTKAPSSNGAAFASDYNKAKEAISSKKPENAEVESTSSPSGAASSSTTNNKVADKIAASVNEKDKGAASKTEVVDRDVEAKYLNAVAKDSGKALQQEGEGLPAEDASVAALDAEDKVSSIALSADLENTVVGFPEQLNPITSQEGENLQDNISLSSSSIGMLAQSADVVEVSTDIVDAKKISESVISGAATVGAGVVSLDSIKRGVSNNDGKNTSSSTLVTLSGKASEGSVDPFSIGADEGAENELSWVLSQMGGGVKSATADSISLDAAKTTVAAGVVAATVDKQGRSESMSSSLLASGGEALSGELNLDSSESFLSEEGILINEPIELRKKEHEAMLGRMFAQSEGGLGDDSSPGGLSSSLNNNVNRPAVTVAALTATLSNPQANNLAMSLPPGHPGWANEMSQKVAWIARDGGHTAHIRLDPPELGSLTVKVSVDSDSNTQISFVAATPQARDLLEGQMGRLREMLAQQGMDLSRADVDVSQQDTSGAQDRANNSNNGSPQGSIVGNDDVDEELIARNLSYVSASGVDYYA